VGEEGASHRRRNFHSSSVLARSDLRAETALIKVVATICDVMLCVHSTLEIKCTVDDYCSSHDIVVSAEANAGCLI
jgi:hypothetical protein